MKWEVFQAICDKVPSLVPGEEISVEAAAKRREIVATSLHEAGEVIYYKDLNFVILDPHWFCHDVIGQVISCKDCGVLESNGCVAFGKLDVFPRRVSTPNI